MTQEYGEHIDIGGLLTIDVASELRKLSQAQLQGPWQIPAEFVRRALRHGAGDIQVELGRQRARIIGDSHGIDIELLMWTAVLLDGQRSNVERHRALTTLEAHGELALLAAAGLPPRRMRVRSRIGGALHSLDFDGKAVSVGTVAEAGPDRVEVMLEGRGIERRAAHGWLADAARFAPASIRIDGRPVTAGFAHSFVQTALRSPLRGTLSIPAQGETAHAWLLQHGMVSGHVAVPDSPCFEAAIELGDATADASAARLREALQIHVAALVDQGVALMLRIAAQSNGLPEAPRARIARLLLQAARKHLRSDEILRAQVFRGKDLHGERLVDLAALQSAIATDASGARTLLALYPDQGADAFVIGDALVLVADEVERSLLTELLKVRMRAPEARDTRGGWQVAAHRWRESVARGVGWLVDRIQHPGTPAVIDDDLLEPGERRLVDTLRTHLVDDPHRTIDAISMCAGAGPPRRSRTQPPVLLLPRLNPTVVACIAAVAHDDGWAYPAYLALVDRFGQPPDSLRRAWLSRAGS